jgi:predicted nucleic acid-binding protein
LVWQNSILCTKEINFGENIMRIYLDNCCFNRPFDDQTQLRIKIETETKQFVQRQIVLRNYELVWSYVLDFENSRNPYEEKKLSVLKWKELSSIHCVENEFIISKAKELRKIGFKLLDSLHIACAICSECDYFITTDKGIYNKKADDIEVVNPIDFMNRLEEI